MRRRRERVGQRVLRKRSATRRRPSESVPQCVTTIHGVASRRNWRARRAGGRPSTRAARLRRRKTPRIRERLQIRPAPLRPHHEERIVERIARGSAAREHRDAQHSLHRPAGARVHDVRIRHAAGLEDFSSCPRPRAPDPSADGERGFPGIDRILDRHVPSLAAGRRAEPVDGAASRADEGGGNVPRRLSSADHPIDRVALGDAAEIQLDARSIEARSSSRSDSRTTCAAPTWRRAAASSSSDGTRPSPRKKPHAFISGPTVMSNAPPDSRV